jgi:diguanylate cyclase (GGDEF)-like protein
MPKKSSHHSAANNQNSLSILVCRCNQALRTLPILLAFLFSFIINTLQAEPLNLTQLPSGSLGNYANILIEEAEPFSLDDVQSGQHSDQFRPLNSPALNYGIGSRPVWVHLSVFNPTKEDLSFDLIAATTWLDYLDIYIVHNGRVTASWKTGDSQAKPFGITPAIGYSFKPVFAPGRSDIYLRAETIDPLVLPIELIPIDKAVTNERIMHYLYGGIYGFLIALMAYNFLLFLGLRKRGYLYYSIYLISVIALNFAYTGHGYTWLWPNQPDLQRYIILVLMMVFSCCGLLFAARFLSLPENEPRVLRYVQIFVITGVSLMGLSITLNSHLFAAIVSFSFTTLFTIIMVLLGILTVRHGRVAGRYFLLAALCGMAGTLGTALAVLGLIPFNPTTYHALEMGIILEATLFALALAYKMRNHQEVSLRSEQLARIDPLTSILNRRAFLELAEPLWSTAERNGRPLSLIMLDIDHFKQVNDQYGHNAGDQSLIIIAQLLTEACRNGDVLARWGGEEFILLLPETDLDQAYTFAQRIRRSIETYHQTINDDTLILTASFGVAQREIEQMQLNELINTADLRLYEAKQSGRNRVTGATT